MKVILLSSEIPDRDKVAEWLRARGYNVTSAADSVRALELLPAGASFALVDLANRQESIKFLRALVTENRSAWTIGISDRRDAGATAEALRLGVLDIVARPVKEADVLAALANVREFAGLAGRRPPPHPDAPSEGVFTYSPRMRDVYEIARRVAPSRCPVLLVGERGTGRETLARAIHRHGPHPEREFFKIACGPDCVVQLAAALDDRAGGTLYIEDVSMLPDPAQSRLEKWLAAAADTAQNGHGNTALRAIAGAPPQIDEAVDRRIVRRLLFEALSVVRLDLPTLRERSQDIPLLAMMFMKDACGRHDVAAKTFSRSALALLSSLPWRGNAAELQRLVERLAVIVPRGVVLQEDVLQHVRFDGAAARGGTAGTLRDARQQFEREFIASALQRHGWRMEAAASELGIERTNLYRKMKQLAITKGEGRA
ncbi:MAG TPA: sigma 54-interacting transcriptional regulator [Vicinamibacterales bacterium]|nr:sigma 54-interacting transcriptional regulator [Vicinamibacterales bacterium]